MIAFLQGTIHTLDTASAIVLVQGVGYTVNLPQRLAASCRPGQAVSLYTMQYVREDAIELYGFFEQADVDFFQQLLRVSGVGPRVALALLSHATAAEAKRAIIHGDTALLTSIPGIGRKTADRIILDLKEQVSLAVDNQSVAVAVAGSATPNMSAIEALLALGYSRQEALAAIQGIDPSVAVEEQVRLALRKAAGA